MSTWTAVLLAHRDDVQAAHSTQRLRSRSEVVGRWMCCMADAEHSRDEDEETAAGGGE